MSGVLVAMLVVGVATGIVSGLVGVGGGILFVPALVLLAGLGQVGAEATSLLAVVPVSLVGAWRQRHYGNLRVRDSALIGTLSIGGVALGVALAHALPARALSLVFAAFALFSAVQLARRSLRAG
jgi:uncharacterized membrane protein YfcA